MRKELEDLQRASDYIMGEMSQEERLVFDQELSSKAALREEVNSVAALIEAVKLQPGILAINAMTKRYLRRRMIRRVSFTLALIVAAALGSWLISREPARPEVCPPSVQPALPEDIEQPSNGILFRTPETPARYERTQHQTAMPVSAVEIPQQPLPDTVFFPSFTPSENTNPLLPELQEADSLSTLTGPDTTSRPDRDQEPKKQSTIPSGKMKDVKLHDNLKTKKIK